MPVRATDRLRAIPLRLSLVVAVGALIIFVVAAFIEVTIILERPAVGDISSELTAVIEYSSGSISALSGLITIYNAVHSEAENSTELGDRINVSEGPADTISVGGDLYQINADSVAFDQDGLIDLADSTEQDNEESDTEGDSETASTRD